MFIFKHDVKHFSSFIKHILFTQMDADTHLHPFEQILLFPQNSFSVAPECHY